MTMYTDLSGIRQRPEPFSVYTADVLWTDPHLSQQMLRYHLNQDSHIPRRMSLVSTNPGQHISIASIHGNWLRWLSIQKRQCYTEIIRPDQQGEDALPE